jgi:phosphotransferase system  glucose/maltose/N-acetylglucosamine-specific IIC component
MELGLMYVLGATIVVIMVCLIYLASQAKSPWIWAIVISVGLSILINTTMTVLIEKASIKLLQEQGVVRHDNQAR